MKLHLEIDLNPDRAIGEVSMSELLLVLVGAWSSYRKHGIVELFDERGVIEGRPDGIPNGEPIGRWWIDREETE